MVGAQTGPGVGSDEKLRALEDALQSDTFARSERLKALLRFLCEAEIEGRDAALTEYTIGTAALGRPADFSPLEDSTVRSRVHELRQRLEKYYAQEASGASVHIQLRKGSYVPRFCPAQAEAEPEPAPLTTVEQIPKVAPQVAASPAPRTPVRTIAIAFLCGAAVMFAAIATWSALTKPGMRLPATHLETALAPSPWTPDLEAFWQPFIGKHVPLIVAYETRFFVRMGPLVVRDWHVNNLGTVESSEPLMQVQRLFGLHQLYGDGNYTDIGSPAALFYLTRLLSSRVPDMSVRSSPEMTASDVRGSNLILIGKPWLAPWIERVIAASDLVDANGRILNVHPAPGQPSVYKDVNDQTDPDGWSEKYSVITMMQNPAGAGRILALTASGSEHPAALASYVTNPDSVRELFKRLHAGPGAPPEYFQVLVRSEFKGKSLVKVEYVTHRALKSH